MACPAGRSGWPVAGSTGTRRERLPGGGVDGDAGVERARTAVRRRPVVAGDGDGTDDAGEAQPDGGHAEAGDHADPQPRR